MQNSITFMGPFIVQNSQQNGRARAGSAILLKVNVRANVRRGPNTMKICGRVWGLFQGSRPKKAGFFQTAPCYVYTVWKFHDFSIT